MCIRLVAAHVVENFNRHLPNATCRYVISQSLLDLFHVPSFWESTQLSMYIDIYIYIR